MPTARDIQSAGESLRQLLGAESVLTSQADMEPFLHDERGAFEGQAGLLVRPDSTQAVSSLLRLCSQHDIGVVPQGGNTGYCGAGTPFSAEHVLLRLDRMNTVREINAENFTLTAEAGATLQQVKDVAVDAGVDFPLSMGSQGSCQVGGFLSTNAGGLNALRYGVARDLVLGLEVVMPDGQVLSRAQGLRKDNTGYRWCDLFLGAEGTLGVITAASLKLQPLLRGRATALLVFPDIAAATEGLKHFRQACDDNVVSFELMMRGAVDLVQRVTDATLPIDAAGGMLVLIEAAADDESRAVDLLQSALAPAMEQGMVLDGVVAASLSQREKLWRFRERIPEAEKVAGASIKHDVSLPLQRIDAFVKTVEQRLRQFDAARLSIFGHLGDGNLHVNVLAPEGEDAPAWRDQHASAVTDNVLSTVVEFGGSFSAEHGIGVMKVDALAQHRADEIALMYALKSVFDPQGIMNPGKVLSSSPSG